MTHFLNIQPQGPSGSNIDIHIHAILTPLGGNNTTAATSITNPPNLPNVNGDDDDEDELPELIDSDDESISQSASEQLDRLISDMNLSLPDPEATPQPILNASTETDLLAPSVSAAAEEVTIEDDTLPSSEPEATVNEDPEPQVQTNTISSIVGMFRRMSLRRGSM